METHHLSVGPLETAGVDFENNIIHGIVAAEAGEFKTQKGAFDDEQLAKIVDLINETPKGNVSYLGHPKNGNDVDRPYLGTFQNARLDGDKVRVDLRLSNVAMKPQPNSSTERSWGQYVMELAEEDPRTLGFSLRPSVKVVPRPGKSKPLWDVQAIKGGDIVREGDATSSFLSSDDSLESRQLHVEYNLAKSMGLARDLTLEDFSGQDSIDDIVEHEFPGTTTRMQNERLT